MPTDSLKASDKMAILIRVATAVSDRPIFHIKRIRESSVFEPIFTSTSLKKLNDAAFGNI